MLISPTDANGSSCCPGGVANITPACITRLQAGGGAELRAHSDEVTVSGTLADRT